MPQAYKISQFDRPGTRPGDGLLKLPFPRTADRETVEPNGVVLSLQPLRGSQKFPQWRTVDADLILIGSAATNVLMFDQSRGKLLSGTEAELVVTHSPFVGERNVLNIVTPQAADLERLLQQIETLAPSK